MSLPNSQSFTPFDPLPASDLNDTVENIEFLNTLIDSSSGHTIIGTNDVRATRFVLLIPAVLIADVDPANTGWVGLDITANTSARAFAAVIDFGMAAGTANRVGYARQTGSAAAQDNLTTVVQNQVTTAGKNWNEATVPLDTSQSFDYSVNNADVSAYTMVLRGYYEYVD